MDQQFLQKVKRVIEGKMTDPDFGVETLAEDMAMSRVQMHRKLKALLNQPAGDLIRTLVTTCRHTIEIKKQNCYRGSLRGGI